MRGDPNGFESQGVVSRSQRRRGRAAWPSPGETNRFAVNNRRQKRTVLSSQRYNHSSAIDKTADRFKPYLSPFLLRPRVFAPRHRVFEIN
jgi:hypothetical protein